MISSDSLGQPEVLEQVKHISQIQLKINSLLNYLLLWKFSGYVPTVTAIQ